MKLTHAVMYCSKPQVVRCGVSSASAHAGLPTVATIEKQQCLLSVNIGFWMIYFTVCTAVAMQRARNKGNKQRMFLGNGSVPTATNMHVIIEERRFLCDPCREVLTRRDWAMNSAGSNTSTVTLRVVGGDEKGSLKPETVKYGRKSQGTRTRERLSGNGQQHIQKTDPSSRQRRHLTKTRP
jgi:hypothetical protein